MGWVDHDREAKTMDVDTFYAALRAESARKLAVRPAAVPTVARGSSALRWSVLATMLALTVGYMSPHRTADAAVWSAPTHVAVCHAPTEDSALTDCTYVHGAWVTN